MEEKRERKIVLGWSQGERLSPEAELVVTSWGWRCRGKSWILGMLAFL